MLKGIQIKSKEELAERIYLYFDEINADPVVYHWTYKLDEISLDEVKGNVAIYYYSVYQYTVSLIFRIFRIFRIFNVFIIFILLLIGKNVNIPDTIDTAHWCYHWQLIIHVTQWKIFAVKNNTSILFLQGMHNIINTLLIKDTVQ